MESKRACGGLIEGHAPCENLRVLLEEWDLLHYAIANLVGISKRFQNSLVVLEQKLES